jgi:hypothetical protein
MRPGTHLRGGQGRRIPHRLHPRQGCRRKDQGWDGEKIILREDRRKERGRGQQGIEWRHSWTSIRIRGPVVRKSYSPMPRRTGCVKTPSTTNGTFG